jgi:hypothetical protein
MRIIMVKLVKKNLKKFFDNLKILFPKVHDWTMVEKKEIELNETLPMIGV